MEKARTRSTLLGGTNWVWRHLWAGPGTLLGLAAVAASLERPRVEGPVVFARSDRGFARWFLRQRGYCAITLGHVVLVTGQAPANVLIHELVHVRQTERWGPFFIPAYLVAMLLARFRGKDPYWQNPFEVEAQLAEQAEARRLGGE